MYIDLVKNGLLKRYSFTAGSRGCLGGRPLRFGAGFSVDFIGLDFDLRL